MKSTLKNYKQSPRKVRLVADLIRGKSVAEAKAILAFLSKKSSPAIEKLLNSALANARSMGTSLDNLFVQKITVDKGAVLRRYRPFARGRAGTIRKTHSIIRLELGTAKRTANSKQKTAKSQSQ